jgi:hypothetical protein
MNYSRLALAALGGTVASLAFGFLVLAGARPYQRRPQLPGRIPA